METLKITETEGIVRLTLRVSPGAARGRIGSIYGEALKIYVTDPPEKGKANMGVIKLLSQELNIPMYDIEIVSGHTSRDKEVEITGINKNDVLKLAGLDDTKKPT